MLASGADLLDPLDPQDAMTERDPSGARDAALAGPGEDEALLRLATSWRRDGRRVALAVVTQTWGSSPRPVGSLLVIAQDGRFAGSVSGGCVESAILQAALDALERDDQTPRLMSFGVSTAQAWSVGLPCGGSIEVWLEPRDTSALWPALLHAQRERRPASLLLPQRSPPRVEVASADEAQVHQTGLSQAPGDELVLRRAFLPADRLIIVGAVHLAQALCAMASRAGFECVVVDPRAAFATPERFEDAPGVQLRLEHPQTALLAMGLGPQDALVTLSHDPKLDDPALALALQAQARYVGALGSRRAHLARQERLLAMGLTQAQLHRVRGPVGLPIQARSAPEIAVSILAELIQVKRASADEPAHASSSEPPSDQAPSDQASSEASP